jgi:hypothetical protein
MANGHRTTRGVILDIDRLKTINEKTVAVGNAGVNARGDLVRGNKVIKTREQIAQESYNISGNNVVKDAKIRDSANDIQPDVTGPMLNFDNPYEDLITPTDPVTIEQAPLQDEARGGLSTALNRSQELAAKLAAQRKRI